MNDGSHAGANDGEHNFESENRPIDAAASGAGLVSAPLSPSDLSRATVPVQLRAAREALGMSAGEVASRTRITIRHINALEAGDYASLPGRPYAIGFARGYALAVGLDGTVIAEAVRGELAGSAPRPEPRGMHQFEVGDPSKTPSRLIGWLALFMVAGILALGAVFWRSYYLPAVALPSLAELPEQSSATVTRIQANTAAGVNQAAAQSANAAVVFTALEEGVWVKFYDGTGKQLMQKQLAKGETYTVPAEAAAPKLWTGRPDALAITVGGQGLPRLADAEKIVKDVPVDAASLRARGQNPGAAASAQPSKAALQQTPTR